jgi:galactokinase
MGKEGHAMKIQLKPYIKTEFVKIPKKLSFIMANSLSTSFRFLGKKLEKKLMESRLACALLCIKLGQCGTIENCPFESLYELQYDLKASNM